LSIFLVAASRAVNPVTGKKEIMLISGQREVELGMQTDAENWSKYGVYARDLNRPKPARLGSARDLEMTSLTFRALVSAKRSNLL
jgi:hypothetical protein